MTAVVRVAKRSCQNAAKAQKSSTARVHLENWKGRVEPPGAAREPLAPPARRGADRAPVLLG